MECPACCAHCPRSVAPPRAIRPSRKRRAGTGVLHPRATLGIAVPSPGAATRHAPGGRCGARVGAAYSPPRASCASCSRPSAENARELPGDPAIHDLQAETPRALRDRVPETMQRSGTTQGRRIFFARRARTSVDTYSSRAILRAPRRPRPVRGSGQRRKPRKSSDEIRIAGVDGPRKPSILASSLERPSRPAKTPSKEGPERETTSGHRAWGVV